MKIEMTLEEWAGLKAEVDELRGELRQLSEETLASEDSTWTRRGLAAAALRMARFIDVLESLRDDGADEVAAQLAPIGGELPAPPAPPPPAVRLVRLNTGLMGNPTEKQGF